MNCPGGRVNHTMYRRRYQEQESRVKENDKKFIQQLYRELAVLVNKGILPASGAESLRAHYDQAGLKSGRKAALIVFSILGAPR